MSQTTTITLLTGDYADRLDEALHAYQLAVRAEEKADDGSQLMNEQPASQALLEEFNELNAEAKKAAAKAKRQITVQAVGRKVWRELKVKHPPRTEGDADTIKGDRLAGVNTETVEDDLVYASVVVPKFSSREAYDEWADSLSEGEFQTILRAAWEKANVALHAPKSLQPSPTRTSGGS